MTMTPDIEYCPFYEQWVNIPSREFAPPGDHVVCPFYICHDCVYCKVSRKSGRKETVYVCCN